MKKSPKLGLTGKILTGVSATLATVLPILSGCAAPSDPYYSHQNQTTNQGQSVPDYLGTTNPKNQAMAGLIFQDWGAGSNPALNAGQRRAYSLFGQHLSSQAQINAVNQGFEQQRQYLESQRMQGQGNQTIIIQESPYKFRDENNIGVKMMPCNGFKDFNNDGIIEPDEIIGLKYGFGTRENMIVAYTLDNLPQEDGIFKISFYSPTRHKIHEEAHVATKKNQSFYMASPKHVNTLSAFLYYMGGPGTFTNEIYWNDHLMGSTTFKIHFGK
jgi:hypothetical protein